MNSKNPVVTLVGEMPGPGYVNRRFRIEGGTIDSKWTVRPGETAWCEFTMRSDLDSLGSFGGEVWPAAWPHLFSVGPMTVHYGQTTTLTDKGKRLIARAIALASSPDEVTPTQWQEYCEAFKNDANTWDHDDACPVCGCVGGCADHCTGIECTSCGGDPTRCDCVIVSWRDVEYVADACEVYR